MHAYRLQIIFYDIIKTKETYSISNRINGDDEPIEDEEIKSHSDINNKRSKNKDSDTIVYPNTNPQDFAKNMDTSGSYK